MFVGRGAAAEQVERGVARVPDLMLQAGWDRDGVAGFDFARFILDAHAAGACGDVVNLFRYLVIVLLRAATHVETSFGQALQADGAIAMGEEFADLRTILRDEGRDFSQIFNVHKSRETGLSFGFPADAAGSQTAIHGDDLAGDVG